MVPPVAVSPLIKTARWSALLVGVLYGKQRFGARMILDSLMAIEIFCTIVVLVKDYLKPIAEEERKVEEAEKKIREEQERIYKQLSEANSDTILK